MRYLIADIGGTNSRCALLGPGVSEPTHVHRYLNADFPDLATLLQGYLDEFAGDHYPEFATLAVAGPVRGDAVQMLNLHWQVTATELATKLRLNRVELINDFAALAQALPLLGDDEIIQCGRGTAIAQRNCVVVGPGTGLGVAGLIWSDGAWHSVSSEGGHASLAASSEIEASLITATSDKFGHCSAERLISGPGLTWIHEFLHGEDGLDPAEIGSRAMAGDKNASASLDLMFALLGGVAGNLALTFGAIGGVYIGGGIVLRYLDAFMQSPFRQRFESKGRYVDYLSSVPTFVISAPDPALTGLAAWSRKKGASPPG